MLISKLQQYLRVSGYSPRTIQAYSTCVKKTYNYFKKPLNTITENEFKGFLDYLIKKGNSPYTVNQYHAAFRMVITKIYKKPSAFSFPYTKRHKKLPVVLSRKEIELLIDSIKNTKHRIIIALSYGAGLRVSE